MAADVLEQNGRSYEQRLAALGMVASADDPTPTIAGILTLGRSPRSWVACAYVQFVRLAGNELGDPVIDALEIDGTLEQVLVRLDDKLKATLATSVDYTSSTLEQRRSPYPLSALQQVVRNAVMHRTYENTNAPIRVYWFADRVEVHSPGGPFGIVNAANFGKPGFSDYRNQLIAGVLKTLGFVQRFGVGIAEAQRSLARNGNLDLAFDVQPTAVPATLRLGQTT